ncbi:MAG: hypothetical protein ABEI52_01765, partial [Halobacteriaceae archaeon]
MESVSAVSQPPQRRINPLMLQQGTVRPSADVPDLQDIVLRAKQQQQRQGAPAPRSIKDFRPSGRFNVMR